MKYPEQELQKGVFFNFLTPLMVLQKYNQFMAFQVRNESGVSGKKGEFIGKLSKGMGTMAGVSDTVFLFCPRGILGMILKIARIPPWIWGKVVFVEFKAYKPLKTKELDPESLLKPPQKLFRDRVTALGFEYRIVAATDVNDAIKQVTDILRDNGVKV